MTSTSKDRCEHHHDTLWLATALLASFIAFHVHGLTLLTLRLRPQLHYILPHVTVKIFFDENGKTHGRGITLPRQKTTVRTWIKCACHGGQAWSYGQSEKHAVISSSLATHCSGRTATLELVLYIYGVCRSLAAQRHSWYIILFCFSAA